MPRLAPLSALLLLASCTACEAARREERSGDPVLRFLVDDRDAATVTLKVATWICDHPESVAARRVSPDSWETTDKDDGGWGVDSDVLLDHFRRPVAVPSLHDFVHAKCPRKGPEYSTTCEGGLALEVRGALLNGWEAVLAKDVADALGSAAQGGAAAARHRRSVRRPAGAMPAAHRPGVDPLVPAPHPRFAGGLQLAGGTAPNFTFL